MLISRIVVLMQFIRFSDTPNAAFRLYRLLPLVKFR
jgi:hypothetical protein